MQKGIENSFNLSFLADSKNESFSRVVVTGFLMPYSPTSSEIADIKTAVSEAVTNCIVHAYKGRKDGTVKMKCRMSENGIFTVKIKDNGCGIEDVHKAMQPLFTTDFENERSGMGFSIMESFCDKVKVVSSVGKGTTVTLKKKIKNASIDK